MKELIVIKLDDSYYGVWNAEVSGVEGISRVHSLPWSSRYFSGVSTIEGCTVALFDLGSCTAHQAYNRKNRGRAILVESDEGKAGGFVFHDEAGRLQVSDGDIVPMPLYMQTPEFSECVLNGDQLIPVVNLDALYHRACQKDWNGLLFDVSEERIANSNLDRRHPGQEHRLFRLGGAIFGVSDNVLTGRRTSEAHVSRIPAAPPHVEGITAEDGEAYALLNLGKFLKLENSQAAETFLLTETGALGFLINNDEGQVRAQAMPMPPVILSNVVKWGIFYQDKVIPLLDLSGSLVTTRPEVEDSRPDSDFPSRFMQGEVLVTEFGFLGMKHGVPHTETAAVIDPKPYRPIPDQRSIILGVAEYEDELLPVLDLAACFGRRTRSRKDDKMILLRNGNFQALIVTEGVTEKLAVAREDQHPVPVNQPHPYVYGCYISEDSIRLILNVEALTTHFDEIQATGLFGQFIQEFSEDVLTIEGLQDYARDDVKELSAALSSGAVEDENEDAKAALAADSGSAGKPDPVADDQMSDTGGITPPDQQIYDSGMSEVGGLSAEESEESDAEPSQVDTGGPGTEEQDDTESEHRADFDGVEREIVAGAEGVSDSETEPEFDSEPAAGADPQTVPVFDTGLDPGSEQETGREYEAESESGTDQPITSAFDTGLDPGSEQETSPEYETESASGSESDQETGPESDTELESEPETVLGMGLESDSYSQEESAIPPPAKRTHTITERYARGFSRGDEHEPGQGLRKKIEVTTVGVGAGPGRPASAYNRYGRKSAVSLLVLLIGILLYFLLFFDGDLPESVPEEVEVAGLAGQQEEAGTNIAITDGEGFGEPAEISDWMESSSTEDFPVSQVEENMAAEEAVETSTDPAESMDLINTLKEKTALLMDFSPEEGTVKISKVDAIPVPEGYDTYIVVKGDTLWHISKRFTGNPFNYPKIAESSNIKNPDLIFPGQTVFVRIVGR